MIYVYTLPEKLADGFCFGGGQPVQFNCVDWFQSVNAEEPDLVISEKSLMQFIASKGYAQSVDRLLVVDTEQCNTMLMRLTSCTLCHNCMPYLEICQACGRINNDETAQS